MKQMQTVEKVIGENTFYIKPFPAFIAANISGDLSSLIAPLIGCIAVVAGGKDEQEIDIMNIEVEKTLPYITSAFSSLSGEKFERLMKKLLTDSRNISVEGNATEGKIMVLDNDLANEVFCGEVQDMYVLCFEVIKINYNGFFKKLGTQYGNLLETLQKVPSSNYMENSIMNNSQT